MTIPPIESYHPPMMGDNYNRMHNQKTEHNSNLMFDKQAVEKSTHVLVRLFRLIFYKRKITLDDFSARYVQYGNRIGMSKYRMGTHRVNDRRALSNLDNITYTLFSRILLNILRLDVVEVAVTIRDTKTGELTTYRSTDPVE